MRWCRMVTAARQLGQRAEDHLQHALAMVLDELGVLWKHCPNEALGSGWSGRGRPTIEQQTALMHAQVLVGMGVKTGVPDIEIDERLPLFPAARGAALEVKTLDGRPSADQVWWIAEKRRCGWRADVCGGWVACIGWVRECGFDVDAALSRCRERGEWWDGSMWSTPSSRARAERAGGAR